MNEPGKGRVTTLTKLAYGVGDLFGGGAMTLVGFYFAPFLTDVVRIDPARAGIIYLVGRIWDAVTDPVMGNLSDRTRTRFGRRRPYFLAGVPLIVIACFFLWFPIAVEDQSGRFLFILTAYLFYSSVITMVMVPYSALAPEITTDYGERSGLMTWRLILSNASSLVCAVLPPVIISLLPDVRHGYMAMGTFFGLFFGLPYLLTFFVVRERVEFHMPIEKAGSEPALQRPFHMGSLFRFLFNGLRAFVRFLSANFKPFGMRSFRNTLTMYLFTMVSMDALMTMAVYMMKNHLQPKTGFEIFLGVMILSMMTGTLLFSLLARRTSKRTAFIAGASLWSILMIGTLALKPGTPDALLFLIFTLVGFFMGGPIVMVYSIMADVPDVDELHTGERREGAYSGLLTFCRKASSAFAGYIVLRLIGWGGYIPPEKSIVDGAVRLVEQTQPERFILTLRILFAFLPVLFSGIALIGALRYRLSPRIYGQLQAFLEEFRERRTDRPALDAERELLNLLGEHNA